MDCGCQRDQSQEVIPILKLNETLFLGADQYQYIVYRKKGVNKQTGEMRKEGIRFYPNLKQVATWLTDQALKGELGAGDVIDPKAIEAVNQMLTRFSHHVSTLEMTLATACKSLGMNKEAA